MPETTDTTETPVVPTVPVPGPLDALKARLIAHLKDPAKVTAVLEAAAAAGLDSMDDVPYVTADKWVKWGVPEVKANRLTAELAAANAPAPAPAPAPASIATEPVVATGASLLPKLPDDAGFLALLQQGGVAHMDKVDVIAAIRAMIADNFGVYGIEDALLGAIHTQAIKMKKPYPEVYTEIETGKHRREYAAILRAMGVSGRFVTKGRKEEFLRGMKRLWALLQDFQSKVANWYEAWTKKFMNPGMMMVSQVVPGAGLQLPPNMMSAPDTTPIRTAAITLIEALNELFAGPGVQVARALAAESIELSKLLDRPDLMTAIGVASREEMIMTLGIGVSPEIVTAESQACQYAQAVLTLSEVTNPRLQAAYIGELYELGQNTPWTTLSSGKTNGTRDRSADSRYRDGEPLPRNKAY